MASSVLDRSEPVPPSIVGFVAESKAIRAENLRFLAGFSDDVRSPANGILGIVDLLLETQLADDQREFLQMTRACAQDLLEKLDVAADYSTLCLQGAKPESSLFDLGETLEAALSEYAQRAALKGTELVLAAEDNLPTIVEGAVTHLQRVLSCVLSEALKNTHHGEIELTASALRGAAGIYLSLQVRTTGWLVSSTELERLRGALVPGSLDCNPRSLRLLTARQLISTIDGQIDIRADYGGGTVFTIGVPLKAVVESQGAAEWDRCLAGKRVLVMTPHAGVARSARRLAEQFGLQVLLNPSQTGMPFSPWLILVDSDYVEERIPELSLIAPESYIVSISRPGREPGPLSTAHLFKPLRRYALYDLLLTLLRKDQLSGSAAG